MHMYVIIYMYTYTGGLGVCGLGLLVQRNRKWSVWEEFWGWLFGGDGEANMGTRPSAQCVMYFGYTWGFGPRLPLANGQV